MPKIYLISFFHNIFEEKANKTSKELIRRQRAQWGKLQPFAISNKVKIRRSAMNGDVFVLLWEDINVICLVTYVHEEINAHGYVVYRVRRWESCTSTNATVIRCVSGDFIEKVNTKTMDCEWIQQRHGWSWQLWSTKSCLRCTFKSPQKLDAHFPIHTKRIIGEHYDSSNNGRTGPAER